MRYEGVVYLSLIHIFMSDPFVGKLAFFRVYSGTMNSGSYVLNSTKGKKERVGRILQMHANKRQELDKVYSGDIAAAVGFKVTTTGDTICDEQAPVIPVSYTHLDVYKRQIVITDNETGNSKTYLIPYGSRIKIQDGAVLEAGDELTEGSVNPHDILKIKMCIRDSNRREYRSCQRQMKLISH